MSKKPVTLSLDPAIIDALRRDSAASELSMSQIVTEALALRWSVQPAS